MSIFVHIKTICYMKSKLVYIILLLLISISSYSQSGIDKILLDSYWEFSEVGKNGWKPASVPGSVQQELIKSGIIPNPFYGLNESKIQWVENKDWEYRTHFYFEEKWIDSKNPILNLKGLDTYSEVFINDSLVLKTDNMFIEYHVEIMDYIKGGRNELKIIFRSPINKTIPIYDTYGINYPADNDKHDKHLSVYTRKAPFHYGWDWGIRIVTMGIWQPISINLYDDIRIKDYSIEIGNLNNNIAEIHNHIEIESNVDKIIPMSINFGETQDSHISLFQHISLKKGHNEIKIPVYIPSPKLWMPRGYGSPNLYNFVVKLGENDNVLDSVSHNIGIRKVDLVQENDSIGRSFYFKVNGVPIFAKGANYIPGKVFLSEENEDYYKSLFNNIIDANMNMIRVWGGGIYEKDRFYDMADSLGILVWQDFMFACTTYPHHKEFLDNVKKEAIFNVKRLRNHPCIALWCGNNEIEEGIKYWGWNSRYSKDVYHSMKLGYDTIFRKLLPKIVNDNSYNIDYIHSSPDTANWGRPHTFGYGDAHYWGIWYGKKPFNILDSINMRFMSEFGFQSFPEMKTIAEFASPKDYSIDSEVMKAHQKSSIGNELIKEYMARDYIIPEKFEDFVYLSLVMQGEGIGQGLKAIRRNAPKSMGALYWQLNDNWPVLSWSGIDYFGNRKSLHFKAREAYKPITTSILRKGDKLNFHLLADNINEVKNLKVSIELMNFKAKVYKKIEEDIKIPSVSYKAFKSININDLIKERNYSKRFIRIRLFDKNANNISEELYFFTPTKNLKLPKVKIEKSIEVKDGEIKLRIKSNKLAKSLFIEVPNIQGAILSDNFFDLLPNEERLIEIKSKMIKKGHSYTINLKHIRDTYK